MDRIKWNKFRVKLVKDLKSKDLGDWFIKDSGIARVFVSKKLSEPDLSLVILHELVELMVYYLEGLLKKRKKEKGFLKGKKLAHSVAEIIEKLICYVLDVSYEEYDKRLDWILKSNK